LLSSFAQVKYRDLRDRKREGSEREECNDAKRAFKKRLGEETASTYPFARYDGAF
jgi:hypothetical protein